MDLITLAEEIGLKPKRVASTQGGEWHCSCPVCGGSDRFIIQSNKQMSKCVGYYFCRKCGIHGDAIQFCREFLGYNNFKEAAEHAGTTLIEGSETLIKTTSFSKKICSTPIESPSDQWIERANKVVKQAHANIFCQPDVLNNLKQRGLPLEAVRTYKIGWLSEDINEPGNIWAIKEKENIWFPAGIVIPYLEHGNVMRLKIRRKDWQLNDHLPKYVAVPGSMSGMSIMGNKKGPLMLVVESELDAYALHYVAGDIAFIVAIGGSTKNPDPVTDNLALKKNILLICHDNDEAGAIVLKKWCDLYPHARAYPTPFGKDIGEALQQGLLLRDWLFEALPIDMRAALLKSTSCWSREDQEIIDWFNFYVHKLEVAHVPTRPAYACFEKEIALGPESPRAKTRELQEGLKLMRRLVEQERGK